MKGIGLYLFILSVAVMVLLVSTPGNLRAQDAAGSETGVSAESSSPAESTESVAKTDLIDPCLKGSLLDPATGLPGEETDKPETQKRIIISLADQKMWVFEGDEIVQRFPVSTGRPGHATPPGCYSVHNRSTRAWSKKYECYMLNWMAVTGDGQIGMHALEGHAYERHLGHVASHGCIRLSHVNALWLYDWVEIGIPVDIVKDYEEPPAKPPTEEEVLQEYPFHW
jgi:lipoprotein-anchoring transpeptidase ErfK/SrfK